MAPAHGDIGAGDIAGEVGGQKGDDMGDFLILTPPLER
jgi:hypothetical protein